MKNLLFIPVYNCEKQISRVLNQMDDSILEFISHILVVNNCSSDNSENVIIDYCKSMQNLPLTLLRNKENVGAGGSHKIAFNYAIDNNYDYIIILHGDDQGNIADILPYLKTGEAYKYDAFLGTRFHTESKLINYSKFRIFGNRVFNYLLSLMLKNNILDTGAGLNMYSVGLLKTKFYMSFADSLSFYTYFLIYLIHTKSNFTYFPISWREDDQISSVKLFSLSKEILCTTFRYVKNRKDFFAKQKMNYTKDYNSSVIYTQ